MADADANLVKLFKPTDAVERRMAVAIKEMLPEARATPSPIITLAKSGIEGEKEKVKNNIEYAKKT